MPPGQQQGSQAPEENRPEGSRVRGTPSPDQPGLLTAVATLGWARGSVLQLPLQQGQAAACEQAWSCLLPPTDRLLPDSGRPFQLLSTIQRMTSTDFICYLRKKITSSKEIRIEKNVLLNKQKMKCQKMCFMKYPILATPTMQLLGRLKETDKFKGQQQVQRAT